jgi:bifunctional NMN adenylyltransferase/nudix hydrolase
MSNKLGVVIGRFQVDKLTPGHEQLLNYARNECEQVLVLIGTRPSPATATNPLPYESVRGMLLQEFPEILTAPIGDVRNHEIWTQNVDTLIETAMHNSGTQDAILYYGRDGFNPWYSGRFQLKEVITTAGPEFCGTHCRDEIGKETKNSSDWRRGVIWAYQNLPHRTYMTVDMAYLHDTGVNIDILLGKKGGEQKWRFPGGFVEPGETFSEAAQREMFEETHLTSEEPFKILGDFPVDDWRISRQKGVSHKTVLMLGWHLAGYHEASDDIAELKWFPLETLLKVVHELVMPEHVEMMKTLKPFTEKYNGI